MSVRNRTFDTTISRFVVWTTQDPDPTGAEYPGPGVFGVTTTGHTAEYVPQGAGGAEVLAEWNGSDLTQFSAPITSGFTNPVFAIYTLGSRTMIRFTADAAALGALAFLNFAATVPIQSMRGRAWVGLPQVTGGDELFAGVTAGYVSSAVAPDFFGMLHLTGINVAGNSALLLGILNGTDPPTGTPLATGSGTGPVSFDLQWEDNGVNSPSYATEFGVPASRVSGCTSYSPPSPVLEATWVGQTPDRVGLSVLSFAGCANPVEVWFWDVQFVART